MVSAPAVESPSAISRPALARAALAAAGIAAVGSLPTQLLSNQSVLVRAELGFGEAGQGLLVSAFFTSAALCSLFVTDLAERYGRRTVTLVAAGLSLASAAGIALGAHSFGVLLLLVALAGLVNGVLQLAANFSLSASIPASLQGFGFGVKQSAPPAAALLAGLAVPAIGMRFGWRWTYAALAVAALTLLVGAARIPSSPPTSSSKKKTTTTQGDRAAPRLALLLTTVSMGIANGAATSLVAFLPQWAHRAGMPTSTAGFFVAVGSALAIAGRVLTAASGDRRVGRNLPVVIGQMALGAVGLAVLALGSVPSVVVGGLIGLAVGWSWPGLLFFAVTRLGRDRPNHAAAAVQAGAFAGGGFGPLIFGLVAGTAGYPVAWCVVSVGMGLGAVLLALARRLFVADLKLRPLAAGSARETPEPPALSGPGAPVVLDQSR